MKRTSFSFVIALFALLAPSAHALEFVTHGDFETRDPFVWATNYFNMIGNWNAPGTTGSSLYLGWGGIAGSYAFQGVDLSHEAHATLSFDLTTISHGAPDTSIFSVSLGYDNELIRFNLGSVIEGQLTKTHVTIPLIDRRAYEPHSPLLFSGSHRTGSNTDIWVDNVSIQAQAVPEPVTLGAFGIGAIGLMRRLKV